MTVVKTLSFTPPLFGPDPSVGDVLTTARSEWLILEIKALIDEPSGARFVRAAVKRYKPGYLKSLGPSSERREFFALKRTKVGLAYAVAPS